MFLIRVLKGVVTTEEVTAIQRGVEYRVKFINSVKNISSVMLSDKCVLVETKVEAKAEARAMKKRYPKKEKVITAIEIFDAVDLHMTQLERIELALDKHHTIETREPILYREACTCKTCIFETDIEEEKKGLLCKISPRPLDDEDGKCLGYERDVTWDEHPIMAGDGNYSFGNRRENKRSTKSR
jgi:hypothetical protein